MKRSRAVMTSFRMSDEERESFLKLAERARRPDQSNTDFFNDLINQVHQAIDGSVYLVVGKYVINIKGVQTNG